jgi:hypothetical protein
LVPPEQVHEAFDCKPAHCRRCGHGLAGIGSAFAPDYHPQEIFEMAQKLYRKAK